MSIYLILLKFFPSTLKEKAKHGLTHCGSKVIKRSQNLKQRLKKYFLTHHISELKGHKLRSFLKREICLFGETLKRKSS